MRYVAFFSCILMSLLLAFLTKDLGQINDDKLFLGKKSLKDYEQFQTLIKEKSLFIITLKKEVNEQNYRQFNQMVSPYIKKYPDIEFLNFNKIYFNKIKSTEFAPSYEFWNKNKKNLQLLLWAEDSISLLATWDSKENKKSFIKDITARHPELSFSGLAYINFLLDQYSDRIKNKVFPLVFLSTFLLILIFTRNFILSLLLFLPSLIAFQLSLFIIQGLYGSLNLITSIVPILIFVIGVSLIFHLYFSFRESMNMKKTFEEKGRPVSMMIFTTVVGFGSLYFSPILVIQQFALSCVISLLAASLFLIAFFMIFSHSYPKDVKVWGLKPKYLKHSLNTKYIILLCFILVASSVIVFPRIKVLTNAVDFFPKESQERIEILNLGKSVLGLPLFEIVFKNQNGFKFKDIKKIEEKEKLIKKSFPEFKLLSLNSFVKEANYLYSAQAQLPPLPVSYFTLRSQLPPQLNQSYPLDKAYRITLFGLPLEAKVYEQKLNELKTIIGDDYEYGFNGLYFNLMQTHGHLISVLAKSFIFTLFIISLLTLILFRKLKIFIVFLLVNSLPVSTAFIFIYLFDFTFNVASVMTFSISLGLIVDSTLHYVFALKDGKPFNSYYSTTLIPIIASALILALSIGVLGTEGFLPIKHFSLSLSFTLLVGLLFDLFILPTIIEGSSLRK